MAEVLATVEGELELVVIVEVDVELRVDVVVETVVVEGDDPVVVLVVDVLDVAAPTDSENVPLEPSLLSSPE